MLSPRGSTKSSKLEYVPVPDKKDAAKTKLVLSKCVREVNFNLGLGAISLPNKRLTSLEGLGVQKGLEKLYLQNNYLESFEYLEVQPRMKELRMEFNRISTLKGLQTQPSLSDIWLKGNPICIHPLYRIMCLLAVGKSLRKVDGEPFSQIERLQASQYNSKAAKALSLGWLLDYQERTDSEYDTLIRSLQKGIKSKICFCSNVMLVEQTTFGKIDEAMVKDRDEAPKVSFVFRDPPAEIEEEEEFEFETSSQTGKAEEPPVVEVKDPATPAPVPDKPMPKPAASAISQSTKITKEPKLVNKHMTSTKANEDQISDLKNIVKTLAENLQTEHVKVSNLEREMFEKEETFLLLEEEKHRMEEELKLALNEERQQRKLLEEKLQYVMQMPKIINNQQFLSGDMLSNMDTIQFYPMIESRNQDKETVLKSGCISFNNTGINAMVTPSEMFSLEFGEPVKISKDSGKKLVVEKASGKQLVLSDPRRDLIAFCIENWLKYKQK